LGSGFARAPGPGAQSAYAAQACPDLMSGVSHRTASLLCYIPLVGWIAAIIVLASDRYRRDTGVRFHAFQGLYLFVAWLIVDWVISPALRMTEYGVGFPFFRAPAHLLQLAILIAWIVMLIKVSQDQHYRLPIIGELAERSVSEQRV